MGLFDQRSQGVDAWSDPYSDQRWVTEHDRDLLHDKYRQSMGTQRGDEEYNNLTPEQLRERAIGKQGFAGTRIMAHYGAQTDVSSEKRIKDDEKLDLSTPEARLEVMGKMSQNANPLDPDGASRCGASSLVAGALYGGGTQGVQTLLDAMAKDHAAHGLKDADPKQAWNDEAMVKLREKLKDPKAQLTGADLELIQEKTYSHFKQDQDPNKKNDPDSSGLSGRRLNSFISEHKEMAKMFKDNDMGLDSIDLNGDGRGEHLTLGIGHDRANGSRSIVYDPQSRQDKRNWGDHMSNDDLDKLRWEERAKNQGEWDRIGKLEGAEYEKAFDLQKAKEAAAVRTASLKYKHDSQIITDRNELKDYRKATDYEANGGKKVNDLDAQTKAENPFMGQF